MTQISQNAARRMAELLAFLDERKHENIIHLDCLYGDGDEWTVRDEISELVDTTYSALL